MRRHERLLKRLDRCSGAVDAGEAGLGVEQRIAARNLEVLPRALLQGEGLADFRVDEAALIERDRQRDADCRHVIAFSRAMRFKVT